MSNTYDNQYLTENFTLDMLTPNPDKADLYDKYIKKMIVGKLGGKYVYKNLGLTYLSAEHESIEKMASVAKNFKLKVNLIRGKYGYYFIIRRIRRVNG